MQTMVNSGRDKRGNFRLVGFIFAAIGALNLAMAVGTAAYTEWFVHHAISTYGRVVDLEEVADDEGSVTYHPVFVFLDQAGKEHGVHSTSGSSPAEFEVGDTVNILYLADKPEKAELDTFFGMWALSAILGFVAVVVLAIGALFLRKANKERQPAIRRGFGEG